MAVTFAAPAVTLAEALAPQYGYFRAANNEEYSEKHRLP
jgi:hypothetical protein